MDVDPPAAAPSKGKGADKEGKKRFEVKKVSSCRLCKGKQSVSLTIAMRSVERRVTLGLGHCRGQLRNLS